MNPDQARYLAEQFIEGKTQSHFLIMAITLQNFITKVGPELEAIEASINTFGKKKLIDVFGQEITEEIMKDLRFAQQSLNLYKVTRSIFDNRLSLVSSNIGLQAFLKEHSIVLAEAGSIAKSNTLQAEIEQYWRQTYAPLWTYFDQIKNKLYVLETILVLEVNRLKDLSESKFTGVQDNGFDIQKELQNDLFQREREAFWDLNKFVRSNTKMLKQANSLYTKQKSQTRVILQSYINLLNKAAKGKINQLRAELAEAEGIVQKSLILLLFAIGTYLTINAVAIIFVEKATGINLERIIQKVRGKSNLGAIEQKAIAALSVQASNSIVPLSALFKMI